MYLLIGVSVHVCAGVLHLQKFLIYSQIEGHWFSLVGLNLIVQFYLSYFTMFGCEVVHMNNCKYEQESLNSKILFILN